jgi:hypothetical protein
MQDFLQRLQDSSLGYWVSTAPTIWAYPTILMLHTIGLAMVVGPNAVLDLRLLGAGSRVPIAELRPVFRIMAVGFLINASTGIALFISEATEKGVAWIFYVKLTIIAVALLVAARLRRQLFAPGRIPPAGAASTGVKLLAIASLALWFGAITAGRLMAYVK